MTDVKRPGSGSPDQDDDLAPEGGGFDRKRLSFVLDSTKNPPTLINVPEEIPLINVPNAVSLINVPITKQLAHPKPGSPDFMRDGDAQVRKEGLERCERELRRQGYSAVAYRVYDEKNVFFTGELKKAKDKGWPYKFVTYLDGAGDTLWVQIPSENNPEEIPLIEPSENNPGE